MIMSVIIPFLALYVGLSFPTYTLGAVMIVTEIVFSFMLFVEVKNLPKTK